MTKRSREVHASAATAAVMAELEASGRVTECATDRDQAAQEADSYTAYNNDHTGPGKVALAPGLLRFRKVDKYPVGRVLNPDVPLEELPTRQEITDPITGRPKKGMRYRNEKIDNSGRKVVNEIVEF